MEEEGEIQEATLIEVEDDGVIVLMEGDE